MTDLEYLIVLNLLPDVGFIRFNNLMKRFGSAKSIFLARRADLEMVDKIGPKIADGILKADAKKLIERELKLIKKYGVKVISCLDESYPANLKEIYDPPIVIYVKGQLTAGDRYAIGVVGSRRASRYGINMAARLGYELGLKGFTVVSGLARGVDASGHEGALKAQARTIAVLGSGLAELYPPEHKELADRISDSGSAVISEFPMETVPLKDNFPRRNRIISGLSLGVVVVEASKNSGALITADFALEQGRELFAVPGQARAAGSFGTNMLIRQGAKLVESADDIAEELKETIKGSLRELMASAVGKAVLAPEKKLSGCEKEVFGVIIQEPKSIDDIAEASGFSAKDILSCLTKLEIKGFVEQLPGKFYIRKG
ncbi:MAG: DNA-processing protein DprA [Candidatus Omnitrophota bacterium]